MILFLAGCVGGTGTLEDGGTQVWTMFPFDGVRTWTYVSTDPTVSYRLVASSSGEGEDVQSVRIYPVEYASECVSADPTCVDGQILRTVKWSSTATDGVHIHGYDVGGVEVELSPPIQLTTDDMSRFDAIETETGGATWTSTMLVIEECPIQMNASWPECGSFELTGADSPVTGTWWATVGNGTAAFALVGESGQWQLSDVTCDGECDGTW